VTTSPYRGATLAGLTTAEIAPFEVLDDLGVRALLQRCPSLDEVANVATSWRRTGRAA
jgi:hypothetical protein